MPTGFTKVEITSQPKPDYVIAPDNSYVKLKLNQAQFYYELGGILSGLVQPASVELVSNVQISDIPNSKLANFQNAFTFPSIKRDEPSSLSLNTDLTDWIPAWKTAKVSFELRLVVVRDNKFQKLFQEIRNRGLAAKAGIVSPEIGIGVGASQMAADFLSYLLEEGKAEEPLPALRQTVDISKLETGYSVFVGSIKDRPIPKQLGLKSNGEIRVPSNSTLNKCSFFSINTISLNRMGDKLKDSSWWQLLNYSKERLLLDADPNLTPEQKKRFFGYMAELAKKWAYEDQKVLKKEIESMMQLFFRDIEKKLTPSRPHSINEYDNYIKQIIAVENREKLDEMVKDYENGLKLSRKLLKKYSE